MDTNTGNNGQDKHWKTELLDKRVVWLGNSLQNGGRALTWEQLQKAATKELPGGQPVSLKIVKRIAFGLKNDNLPTTLEEAMKIELPTGGGAISWEKEREKERARFASSAKAKRDYNERQKKLAVNRKSSSAEATKETSLENIRQALVDLPDDMTDIVNQLKMVMKQHHYRKLELDLQDDGKANLALEPLPQVQYTQL